MSWREFSLRSHAHRRQELNEWRKVREIAYHALIGSHVDPKRLPKNIRSFMPIEGDKKQQKISESHKQAFIDAFKKYLDEQQT